jgi:pyridinium-3,5-biscarboxylic acid mononucleotide sulfurtransferase
LISSDLRDKEKQLFEILENAGSLLVAFSGGADSSFLLAAAARVLKDNAAAVTADSNIHPSGEKERAVRVAKKIGVRHKIIHPDETRLAGFAANPKNRCYICKKNLFKQTRRLAEDLRLAHVAHGANVDDLNDFRPGAKAAEEWGVLSPLVAAGMKKSDIRALSKKMGLETWNKPATGCLATRIPYGTPITREALSMIDRGEAALREAGFEACRARHHGETARIEIDRENFQKMLEPEMSEKITAAFKQIGYSHVSLDLEGRAPGPGRKPWKALNPRQKY